jgi:hypothetical protein
MTAPAAGPAPSSTPARPGAGRALQIGLRSLHIVGMALLLGGVAAGQPAAALRIAAVLALGSGGLLTAAEAGSGCLSLSRGAGWALYLKLGLLAVGKAVPALQLPAYLAAAVVASVGSHMPRTWRHFALRRPAADPGRLSARG